MESEKANLGVLFVHGIGEQGRAQTLLGFGEPLIRWIHRWMGRSTVPAEGLIELPDASLQPPDGPPYAAARIRPPDSQQEHSWLLAESWWARAFAAPRYGQLVRWSVQTVPWTIASHFGTRLRGAVARLRRAAPAGVPIALGRVASYLFYLMVGLALIPVVVLVLIVLLVVGLVPSGRVRRLVGRAQQRLAATVGDSYVLLESPIQQASIVGQVKRDLRWLAHRCDAVAVVAHSQGAAIAHAAVRSDPPLNLRLLLTFGSGLKKLSEIRALARSRAAWVTWAPPLGLLLLAVSLPPTVRGTLEILLPAIGLIAVGVVMQALSDRVSRPPLRGTLSGVAFLLVAAPTGVLVQTIEDAVAAWVSFALIAGLILLVWGIRPSMGRGVVDPERLRLKPRIRWVDIYSSADPVPDGPLSDDPDHLLAADVEVTNYGSLFTDHTAYWENQEQFVSRVAAELAELDSLPLVPEEEREGLELARRRRAWRIPWLTLARGIIFLLTVLLFIRSADLGLPVRRLLRLADAAVGLLPFLEEPGLADADPGRTTRMGIGVAAVLLAAVVLYTTLRLLWRWWSSAEVTRILRRLPVDPWNPQFVLFLLVLAAGVEAGILWLLGWERAIPTGFLAGGWFGMNLALIALVTVLVRRRHEEKSAAWFVRGALRAAAIGGMIALLTIPGVTLAALHFSGGPLELLQRSEAVTLAGIAWLVAIAFTLSPLRRWVRDRVGMWDRANLRGPAETHEASAIVS